MYVHLVQEIHQHSTYKESTFLINELTPNTKINSDMGQKQPLAILYNKDE